MDVRRWRGGVVDWVLALAMLVAVADLLFTDVTQSPPWWRWAFQAFTVPTMLTLAFRTLSFRATADPEGLRVRSGRRTIRLPWGDIAGAEPGPGVTMRIRLTAGCGKKPVTVPWSGVRPPKRAAAEIDAMVRDPSLRPC